MIHEQHTIIEKECLHPLHTKLCWSALFGGAFVGVGLGFLLHLFGMAIGLSAYSATPSGTSMIAIGGLLGLLIGVIVSMGAAGYVSGYLGRFYGCHCHGGIIYGFITWSLALALSALLIIPMSHYMAFYKNSLKPSMTTEVSASTSAKAEPEKAVATSVANKTVGPVGSSDLAWAGWLMFLLFFVGALASCVGACIAMLCRHHDHNHYEHLTTEPRSKL